MEPFGLSLALIGLFVGFGLLIGVLFGFFGMGGSFLVTPALLVLGYSAKVAVGSGLAFVFGTSIIAALRHRDLGQVDYKLAGLMTVGMTAGIEVGKRAVFHLESLGLADLVIGVAYVGLLAGVGLFTLRDSLGEGDATGGEDAAAAAWVQRHQLPPTVELRGGPRVSVWIALAIAAAIGVLSGFLGVGGGFLLMPAMVYGLGVPASVAVGTDALQITVSGGFGAFVYAQANAVDVPAVTSLLAGSALGARVGSAATNLVDDDEIKGYFAAMLLAGSVAVASKKLGAAYGVAALDALSVALIFGSAVLVSGAIVYSGVKRLREGRPSPESGTDRQI
ncbi:sulfite exporter TauE/SafE family protein [Halegenticoccus tardaugens]|uniref:sulfite exporter TauE/SafE family protein n=1 Tax=Halegenticoccus tardaugens TaxID=2071624 RepID=UPI00100BE277|nr:sulfite exporter TauE/SafE family protein [Halegenticoccus tardaugens]